MEYHSSKTKPQHDKTEFDIKVVYYVPWIDQTSTPHTVKPENNDRENTVCDWWCCSLFHKKQK